MRSTLLLPLFVSLAACGGSLPPGAAQPRPVPTPEPVRPPVASAPAPVIGQGIAPSFENPRIWEIVGAVSASRVERDVRTLVGFGTRHTLSDTLSATRGIGAARRWLFAEFQRISAECGGCLEVRYVGRMIPAGTSPRIPVDVEIISPIAIHRGRRHPDRFFLMTAHFDSRVTDVNDATRDAPGANDNASGVAAVLESARLLTRYPTDVSVVYAPLAGEEQSLFGASILVDHARDEGWTIEGVLNNDVVGNSRGVGGLADNGTVRVFAPGINPSADRAELQRYLSAGGELDGPTRQLARRLDRVADVYLPTLDVQVIYRLDRFGRGGDHRPFFLAGHPAIRITEPYEDYRRQHQDVRVEDGVEYGDLPDAMDFEYLAKVAALNSAALASLAWAPPPPAGVRLSGGVSSSTTLQWDPSEADDLAGYRVYWRLPTDPTWTHSRWVGNVARFTLEGVVIDNFFFGVAAVDGEGNESVVVFASE